MTGGGSKPGRSVGLDRFGISKTFFLPASEFPVKNREMTEKKQPRKRPSKPSPTYFFLAGRFFQRSGTVLRVDMTTSDKIIANAAALGIELGISERELARSALALAIGTSEKHGDPDGYLAALVTLTMKGKNRGR